MAAAADRRVGVAVDFSACSKRALRWAAENLVMDGDHLILINVQEEGEGQLWEAAGSPFIPLSELCEPVVAEQYGVELDAVTLDILTRVARRKQVEVFLKIYWGNAAKKICKAINDIPLSCLVIGYSGLALELGEIERVLYGSVCRNVLKYGNCPVTVVEHAEQQEG